MSKNSTDSAVRVLKASDFPLFDQLPISTKTVELYTNMIFDLSKLFWELPYYEIKDIPLTKKKKKPDIKKIFVPSGSIISVRLLKGGECFYRGIVTRPKKLEISQLRRKRKEGTLTAKEQEELESLEKTDRKNVLDFQNQVCIILNIGTRECRRKVGNTYIEEKKPANINIMAFHDNFKIVGLKCEKEARLIARILWHHIKNIGCYTLKDNKLPRFVVDWVMTNLDFNLGFTIDRKQLNKVMNDTIYKEMIHSSTFEPTSHTNVKIRMKKYPPNGWRYICLVFSPKNGTRDGYPIYKATQIKSNPYQHQRNKNKSSKFHTLLVPRSSKVIMSGKYMQLLEDQYKFFLDVVLSRKEEIEEKQKVLLNNLEN